MGKIFFSSDIWDSDNELEGNIIGESPIQPQSLRDKSICKHKIFTWNYLNHKYRLKVCSNCGKILEVKGVK